MDLEKGMMLLLWIVVAVVIVGFVVLIIVGYSNNFEFFYSLEDVSELTKSIANKSTLLG